MCRVTVVFRFRLELLLAPLSSLDYHSIIIRCIDVKAIRRDFKIFRYLSYRIESLGFQRIEIP